MKIHSLDPFVLILPLPLLLRVFDAVIEKYLDATKRTGEGETFFSRDKFRTVYGLYIYISRGIEMRITKRSFDTR